MVIHTLNVLKDNFVYILAADNGACAVVDPGEGTPVRKFLDHKRLRLTHILCTHHHLDHIGGIEQLARETQIEVWASRQDRERIPKVTRVVGEGEALELFGEPLKILDVPGHTLGQIAYHFPRIEALFTGDTLFSGGCGRLFEGTPEQMYSSLQKIKALPAATRIYFGHEYTLRNIEFIKHELGGSVPEELFDYEQRCRDNLAQGVATSPTTLAQELKINPFIYSKDVASFSKWREARNDW
jgi:hydroxyacylglutathione hydrolase